MTRRMHKLFLPLIFPVGIAPGEGSDDNLLRIARNGNSQPLLRGTAIAGALRNAWSKHLRRQGLAEAQVTDSVHRWFGEALGSDTEAGGMESRLQVCDCVLRTGGEAFPIRTHHLRNRHTGAVADKGLFSLEVCPPETRAELTLWLRDDEDGGAASLEFLQALAGLLQSGLTLGGNAARGVGLVQIAGPMRYRCFDLTRPDQYAAYLDDHRRWRNKPELVPAGDELHAADVAQAMLHVQFQLGIPRGQDVLVGDGQGIDYEIEPQRVTAADGKVYWRLPGASLRGLFRGWVTRLAARQNQPVADHVDRQRRIWRGELLPPTDQITGDNLGWCFLPKDDRRHDDASTACPVAGLFGSLFQAGRIFISDGYARCSRDDLDGLPAEEQRRMHVAVDRITGGAAESMLFENTVLTAYADGSSPVFPLILRVENPSEQEARWLAKTLRALDLGLLRVGSSKSSGRLALVAAPQADGTGAEYFRALRPAAAAVTR